MKEENDLKNHSDKRPKTIEENNTSDDFYDDDVESQLFEKDVIPSAFKKIDNKDIDSYIEQISKKIEVNEAKTKLQESETKRYEAIQKQKEKQRKAIKDLLEHTGGNIPAFLNEISKELKGLMDPGKKLELNKSLEFSQETAAFRIPKFAESFNLDGASDFFGMTIAEQELLYDRIGLFKGIIVDHSKETPVEQGYRNAVKYLKSNADDNKTKPVAVFYKKPRLSGFFESSYSLDEGQKKTQEAGIFNLGFGLSVDVNTWFTSTAIRGGYSYGKEHLTEKNTQFKKVSITSNFFLPKIELSFDSLNPCADDDLINHLESLFTANEVNKNDLHLFEEINKILMNFGHFVPTSLVIGARLYSTEKKELTSEQTIENVLTKQAADFKMAISTMSVEAGVESKMNKEDSSKTASENKSEKQSLQLNAIGGEGAFVNDMSKWVKSTEKYTSWGLVRFDNLVPIIEILPKELKDKCKSLFSNIVNELSIEQILEKNAHYLFYKGYYEVYGKNAQPEFYLIKNSLSDSNVLSISSDTDIVNYKEVVLKNYERKDSQLWYIAPSGKIYSKEKYETNMKFVLSLDNDKLVITNENYFDNQIWSVGGGMLRNVLTNKLLIGKDKVLFEVKKQNEITNKFAAWFLISEKEFNSQNVRKKTTISSSLKVIDAIDTIREGEYLLKSASMISNNKKVKLKIENNKFVITSSEITTTNKTIWESKALPENTDRIVLLDGKLIAQNSTGEPLEDLLGITNHVSEFKLLDNGNFEASDRDGRIVWESNSIIYSTIKKQGSDEVVSVHHADFDPNMSYSTISLTTYPFANADHQLWYMNKNNQIVCKATHNGKQFAITCDDKGVINLNTQKTSNITDQQWKVNSNGFGIIENVKYAKKLKSSDFGTLISADSSSNENWEMKSVPNLFGKDRIAKVKKPTLLHKDGTDYFNFNSEDCYIHNDNIDLNGSELRGLRIFRYSNRYALEIVAIDGKTYKSNSWDPYVNKLDRDKAEFQRSPLYLVDGINKISFKHISGDKMGLKYVDKKGLDVMSSDNNVVKMKQKNNTDHNIDFVDLNWVKADDNEKVIAIGLGISGNRLSPYIITIPK